jgi:predicted nuclease with TOPRIM domain
MPNACQFILADLNVSDIESLRSENDELTKKVEGMQEVLKELLKDQMKLEDEEAKIRRQKV